MGLVRVQTPKGVLFTQTIEDYLPWRYKLRKCKLSTYYSVTKFHALFPKIKSLKGFLIASPVVHGVEVNGEILIHPDTVMDFFRKQKGILPRKL